MGSIIGKRRQVTTTQVVITKNNNSPGQASQPRTVGGGGGGGARQGGGGGGGGYNRDEINITTAVGGNAGIGQPQGDASRELPEGYNFSAETQRPNAMQNINIDNLAKPSGGIQREQVCHLCRHLFSYFLFIC
jgi:hypothetical protein